MLILTESNYYMELLVGGFDGKCCMHLNLAGAQPGAYKMAAFPAAATLLGAPTHVVHHACVLCDVQKHNVTPDRPHVPPAVWTTCRK
jgi:hypothetical protein